MVLPFTHRTTHRTWNDASPQRAVRLSCAGRLALLAGGGHLSTIRDVAVRAHVADLRLNPPPVQRHSLKIAPQLERERQAHETDARQASNQVLETLHNRH